MVGRTVYENKGMIEISHDSCGMRNLKNLSNKISFTNKIDLQAW